MRPINTDDAVDWQRNALNSIYVYDRDRTGTMLLFDSKGDPVVDLSKLINPPLMVPISDLEPDNREALLNRLKAYFKSNLAGPPDDKDIEARVQRVITNSELKLMQRPLHYRYAPNNNEQRQILRYFLEINKYPQASGVLYRQNDTSPIVLMTLADRNNATHLSFPKPCMGFNQQGHKIIGVADTSPLNFPATVAEELFHALDRKPFITRPHFSAKDGEELEQQAASLYAAKQVDSIDSIRLLEDAGALREIKEHCKDTPTRWDREIFAKLASHLALRRYKYRNNDPETERKAEAQVYNTSACKAAIKNLDTLQVDYESISKKDRNKAEHFAANIAHLLEPAAKDWIDRACSAGASAKGII